MSGKSYANILKVGLQNQDKKDIEHKNVYQLIDIFKENISNNRKELYSIYYSNGIQLLLKIQKYIKIPEFEKEISMIKQIPEYLGRHRGADIIIKTKWYPNSNESLFSKDQIEFMKKYNIFYKNLKLVIDSIEQRLKNFLHEKCGSINYLVEPKKIYDDFLEIIVCDILCSEECILFHNLVRFLIGDHLDANIYNQLKDNYMFRSASKYLISKHMDETLYIGFKDIIYELSDILEWIERDSKITHFQNLENIIQNCLDKYLISDLNNILIEYLK